MKKTLNAYLYPTPAQLAELSSRNKAAASRNAETKFYDEIRRFLSEETGLPADSIVILDAPGDGGDLESSLRESLGKMVGVENIDRYLPLSDAAQDLKDLVLDEEPRPVCRNPKCPICAAQRKQQGFVWVTHKGTRYFVRDMATQHIFYSLRMVFNHSVPPVFRVGEFKRYPDVPGWSPEYRRDAIAAFVEELDKRITKSPADGGLEQHLLDQYLDIKANATVILALGI